MEVDQSGSGLAVAHVKRRATDDWSSSFVTLSPIGPDCGGWSDSFTDHRRPCRRDDVAGLPATGLAVSFRDVCDVLKELTYGVAHPAALAHRRNRHALRVECVGDSPGRVITIGVQLEDAPDDRCGFGIDLKRPATSLAADVAIAVRRGAGRLALRILSGVRGTRVG